MIFVFLTELHKNVGNGWEQLDLPVGESVNVGEGLMVAHPNAETYTIFLAGQMSESFVSTEVTATPQGNLYLQPRFVMEAKYFVQDELLYRAGEQMIFLLKV